MQTSQPVPAAPGLPSPARHAAEFTVGGVISRTFSVWWKNVVKLSLLTLLAWVPAMAAGAYAAVLAGAGVRESGTPGATAPAMVPIVVAGVAVTVLLVLVQLGAVTYGAVQHLAGNPVRFGAMLGAGFGRAWPLLLVGVLSGLIVLGGTLLLVIPGIIFAFALSVAIPAVVAERIGPVEAVRRSFALTKGSRLLIFAAGLVVGVVNGAANGLSDALLPLLGSGGGALFAALAVLGVAVKIVFATLPTVLPAVVYHDLRVAKEGADTSALAKVFE